eukprot:1020514-Pyramimonas_sp.AAC.3
MANSQGYNYPPRPPWRADPLSSKIEGWDGRAFTGDAARSKQPQCAIFITWYNKFKLTPRR